MITLYDDKFIFSEKVRFLKNNDNVIVINGCSGAWGAISSSMLDNVHQCIANKMSPKVYLDSIENDSDKDELAEIFQVLIEEQMIVKPGEEEFRVEILDVEFKLTNKCNLKCLHCAAGSDISKEDVLRTEEIKIILDKIFKMNIETLLLTGGEPLIRQDIELLLTYIRSNFKGTVNMITNGTFIDQQMAMLLKNTVNAVSISIDGYDEKSTEAIRGKGVYNKIMKAVTYLKEAGFGKDNIILTMVATNQNFHHEKEFYKLCENLNVTGGVRQFSAMGRGRENYDKIGVKDYFNYTSLDNDDIEEIRGSLQCKFICRAGGTKFTINEFGDMYPCLLLESDEYRFGNILFDEPSDIFSSNEYGQFIKNKIRTSSIDNRDKCKQCNVRYFCMEQCLAVNNSIYNNKEICEARCKQMQPYLSKVVWE